jgi:hypothetical protein
MRSATKTNRRRRFLQVGGDGIPELRGLQVVLDEGGEFVVGSVTAVEARLKAAAKEPGVPVLRGVGRIVEHLADDLAA